MRYCLTRHTKRYTRKSRRSPPSSANSPGCKRKLRTGNDGRLYRSKADKNGTYRWVLHRKGSRTIKRRTSSHKRSLLRRRRKTRVSHRRRSSSVRRRRKTTMGHRRRKTRGRRRSSVRRSRGRKMAARRRSSSIRRSRSASRKRKGGKRRTHRMTLRNHKVKHSAKQLSLLSKKQMIHLIKTL